MSLWKFGDFEAEVDFTDADFLDALDEAKAAMHEAEQNVPVVGKNSDIIRAQCSCFYVFFDHCSTLKLQKQKHWTANTISICQTRIQRSSSRIRSHSQMETVSREGTTRNSMVKENIPIPEGKRDEYFI